MSSSPLAGAASPLRSPNRRLLAPVLVLAAASVTALLLRPDWTTALVLLVALLLGAGRSLGRRECWRPADDVTSVRLGLVLVVTVLALGGTGFSWLAVALCSIALGLDACDGYVARRTGPTSAGAEFDESVDALLVLVLSAALVPLWGWWAILPGTFHYLFRALSFLRPSWQSGLGPSFLRKTIAAAQGVLLLTAGSPLALAFPVLGITCAATALAALVFSFGRDILWLETRNRPGPPPSAETSSTTEVPAAAAAPSPVEASPTADGPSVADPTDAAECRRVYETITAGAEVVAQLAQSQDGFIATSTGDAEFVSGRIDRAHLHRIRAAVGAVLVGCGTVIADDPQLTVRAVPGDDPVRVVLDPHGRVPPTATVLSSNRAPTLWLIGPEVEPSPEIGDHVRIVRLPSAAGAEGGPAEDAAGSSGDESLVSPRLVLDLIREHVPGAVLVEGGGRTVSAFLAAGVLDRLFVTTAPVLIGNGIPGIRFAGTPIMADALRRPFRRYEFGPDICTEYVLSETALGRSSRDPARPVSSTGEAAE